MTAKGCESDPLSRGQHFNADAKKFRNATDSCL